MGEFLLLCVCFNLLSLCIIFFSASSGSSVHFRVHFYYVWTFLAFSHPSLPFSNGPSLTSYFVCYERGVTKDKTYLGQVVKLSAKMLRYL